MDAGVLATLLACGTLAFANAPSSPEASQQAQGRKLFGGYKITPKPCTGTSSSSGTKGTVKGICMFNYECSRRSGEVVGTCTDSFLFGACCSLPPGSSYIPDGDIDELNESPQRPFPTPSPGLSEEPPPGNFPAVLPTGSYSGEPLDSAVINELFLSAGLHRPTSQSSYVSPDTVLLHKNGSVVSEEAQDLEELLFNKPAAASRPVTDRPTSQAPVVTAEYIRPELSTFSYVTGPDGVVISSTNTENRFGTTARLPAHSASTDGELVPTTKLVSHASTGRPYPSEPSSWDQILQSNSIPTETHDKSSSVKPYVTSSTTFYTQPPHYTKPSFYSSTTKWMGGQSTQKLPSFRPKPQGTSTVKPNVGSSTKLKWTTTKRPASPPNDNFVKVPLLSADSQSSVTVSNSHDNVEVATNAASISHILSILNDSSPSLIDPGPEPIPEPEAHPDPHNTSSGISTWVSINGKPQDRPQTTGYVEDDETNTTPSKDFPTDTTSDLVTHSTFFTAKKPSTTVSYYSSVPTRRPPSTPSSVNIHGPGFSVRPSSPHYSSRPSPTSYYKPEHNTYGTTVLFNPAAELGTYSDHSDTTLFNYSPTPNPSYHYSSTHAPSHHYNPTPDSTFHYSPSPDPTFHYPPTPPPPSPPSTHYSPSPSPNYASTSHRPPVKPSQIPPPAPTVIVLGPYDPVSSNQPNRKPSTTTESSTLSGTGLVYTKIPSNGAHGGHVTIITKKPSRPGSSTTVTKRTPITVSTDTVTTASPTQDIVQSISVYPVGTVPPGQLSENDLVAFPPVRDPNLNVTSHPGYSTTQNDEDYTEYPPDYTTPHLDDSNLDNKVHGFVDKIVQSLQGNFEELENVLFSGDNGTKATTPRPSFYTTTTRRPTILSTILSSVRPSRPTTKRPPSRPTRPSSSSTATIVITTTTKRPPSKRPSSQSTTRRPSSSYATTKRPRPSSSATTKKPKPTKKKPTTTAVPAEEEDEEWSSTSGYGSSTASSESTDPDYRSQCGVRPHVKSGRVVGGKGARFGEWPWQVLVRESTWLGLFTKNKCGGVLITHKYVITAAHCQPGFLASLVAVFGEYDISGELEPKRSVSKNVRRVIVHRQYDAATFENDLALLELESPVSYDTHIVPICMPQDNEDFTGRMATVTGWGRLKYGGGVPNVLQEVQVPVIENSVCQEMFQTSGHAKNIISSFLCAGYANGQRDSCEGDSGGPLMVERDDGHWVLVGTVSHGIKCAAPYLPGVYMRTTYYKPWLKSITGVS